MIRVSTRSRIRNTLLILNSLNWQFRGPGTPISCANERKGGRADSIFTTKKCVHLRVCTMLIGDPCEASLQVSWFLFQKWVYYSASDELIFHFFTTCLFITIYIPVTPGPLNLPYFLK